MRKLFATDLDGTLIEGSVGISNYTLMHIKKLNALKHCFVIDTGRPYHEVESLQHKYGIKIDYFVTLNGALILDKQGNIIAHETILKETIDALYSEVCNEECEIFFSTGFKNFKLTAEDKSNAGSDIFIESIEKIKDVKISKIALIYKKQNAKYVDMICRKINCKFGSTLAAYRNVNLIDIAPAGCSKGVGIEYIREKEKIDRKNTFAIGDSWNDEPMFKSVENSFTFRRAEKELQMRTKYVVDSVGECIEKYIIA